MVNADSNPQATQSVGAQNEKMEINQAYGLIRGELTEHGLYKTSLKQGRIVLAFLSPQMAARHFDTIAKLAKQTGYELSVHPHPNQNAILQIARQKLRDYDISIKKGPSIHVDRGEVEITAVPETDIPDDISDDFEMETGYRLVINT